MQPTYTICELTLVVFWEPHYVVTQFLPVDMRVILLSTVCQFIPALSDGGSPRSRFSTRSRSGRGFYSDLSAGQHFAWDAGVRINRPAKFTSRTEVTIES